LKASTAFESVVPLVAKQPIHVDVTDVELGLSTADAYTITNERLLTADVHAPSALNVARHIRV
jgi:hypothetical protein